MPLPTAEALEDWPPKLMSAMLLPLAMLLPPRRLFWWSKEPTTLVLLPPPPCQQCSVSRLGGSSAVSSPRSLLLTSDMSSPLSDPRCTLSSVQTVWSSPNSIRFDTGTQERAVQFR